jgi:hypothetical protein
MSRYRIQRDISTITTSISLPQGHDSVRKEEIYEECDGCCEHKGLCRLLVRRCCSGFVLYIP